MERCKTCKFYQRDGVGKGYCTNSDVPIPQHKKVNPQFGCILHRPKEEKR